MRIIILSAEGCRGCTPSAVYIRLWLLWSNIEFFAYKCYHYRLILKLFNDIISSADIRPIYRQVWWEGDHECLVCEIWFLHKNSPQITARAY
jgi:hypothetical protein